MTAFMEKSDYRTFLVVVDKADWAYDEEGVLFVWDDRTPQPGDVLSQPDEVAIARRLPGLKTVAERLAGVL